MLITMVNNLIKGIFLVLIVHIMKEIVPLSLPLNTFTVFTAAILGVPGVVMLTILATIIN